ncbi:MAG: PhnD/SsuA/transferrin family substrate-binding protein, partial [Sulfuriferula sp.]
EPIAKIPGQISAGFMALSSSGIAFPEDMKGKRIGFTDQDSMVTQLALAELRSKHIDPEKYFKSVAYYHDVDGIRTAFKYKLIDVGVANTGVLTLWNNSGMDLNLLMQSKGVPHLTFAVRADLPVEVKKAVTQALVNADKDKEAQSYFSNTGFSSFEVANLADYADLVKMLHIH